MYSVLYLLSTFNDESMEKNAITLLIAGGVAFVATYAVCHYLGSRSRTSSSSPFVYLGSPYVPFEGGSRGELSEECLQHPGYRMCSLTDGTSGVCGTSGMCVTDMEMDIRRNWSTRDDIKMPLCLQPIFKEGCERFCRCRQIKDLAKKQTASHGENNVPTDTMGECLQGCRSTFYPI